MTTQSQDLGTAAEVLGVTDVVKTFGGVHALRDVTFSLRAGEVHALVGENGAGKSTLIKVLTGVYQPDAGRITYLGQDVSFPRPLDAQDAGISTIYQEVNLVPLMSVARNLFLGREPRRWGIIDLKRMNAEASELLHDYGIDVDVNASLQNLGLGIQQMVAIVRAVSTEAKVVIMDEPTSSLEPREVDRLFEVVSRLRDAGIAIIYVSHRMDELYRICERVTVMRDGAVVHAGRLDELDRVRLVSIMLGRDLSEVRRHGVTSFSDTEREVEGPVVLTAAGLHSRPVLQDVSLSVRQGEIVGLGGLLGSGRTETLKAISGSLGLDDGDVSVLGRTLRTGSTRRSISAGIAMIPEDRKAEGILPELSIRENIVLAAMPRLSRFGLVSRRKQDAVVKTFMDRLQIKATSADQAVRELSGGNQQKVVLARWLAMSPRVLLLDEPTRGIDVGAKAEVQALVDELAQQGLSVVLVSSELEELLEGATRIVVLKEGAVVRELVGDEVSEDGLLAALAVGAAQRGEHAPSEPAADDVRPGQESA